MINHNNKTDNEFQCIRITSPNGEISKPHEIEVTQQEQVPCSGITADDCSACDQSKGKSKIWQFIFGNRRRSVSQKKDTCCCCCTHNKCEKKDKLVQSKYERNGKNEERPPVLNISSYNTSKHKKTGGDCPGKVLPLQRRGCGCHLYFCIDSKSKGGQMKMKRIKNMKNEKIKCEEYFTCEENNQASTKVIFDCEDTKKTSLGNEVQDLSSLSETSPKITIYCDDPNKTSLDNDMKKPIIKTNVDSLSPIAQNKKLSFKEAFIRHKSIDGDTVLWKPSPTKLPNNQRLSYSPSPTMTGPLSRSPSPPTIPIYSVEDSSQYQPFNINDKKEEEKDTRNSVKAYNDSNKEREILNSIIEEPNVFDNRIFATLQDHEEASRPRKGSILRNRNSQVVLNLSLLNENEETFKMPINKTESPRKALNKIEKEESSIGSVNKKESPKKSVAKEDSNSILRSTKPVIKSEGMTNQPTKSAEDSDPEEEAIFKEYDNFRKSQRDKGPSKNSLKSQTFVRNSLINIRKEFHKNSQIGTKNSLLPKNYLRQMSIGSQRRSRTFEILEKLDSIEEKIKDLERGYENKEKNMTIGMLNGDKKSVVSTELKNQEFINYPTERDQRKQKEKPFCTSPSNNILFKSSFVEIKTEEEDVYLKAPKSVSVIKKIRSGSSTCSKKTDNQISHILNINKISSKSECKIIECLNPQIVVEYPKKTNSDKKRDALCCDKWRRISEELKISNPDMTKFSTCPCVKCSKKGLS